MQKLEAKKLMDSTKAAKGESYFRLILNSVILAGIIILFTGIYYCVIKAGIPYQDPPLELQMQYTINMGIGNILVKDGFLISICGGIASWLFKLVMKKKQKN
jgi:hypothetical protein